MKNIVVIIFLLAFFCCDVHCQDNATLIRGQLESWQNAFPPHNIHAFFNQPKYAPGDTAYFSVYFQTAQGVRIPGRQILQLSLFHCAGKQLSHVNFFVRDGVGFNQVVLPDTLEPGLYEIDIYSDWMKNFDRSLFFHYKMEVVDKNQIGITRSATEVSFFPEGGNFAAGVTNKIVLQTREISPTNGDLLTEAGEFITSFSIDGSGMGLIVFTPEAVKKYSARINGKLYALPAPVSGKLSVLLTPQPDQKPVKLILATARGSALREEELLLLIISQGQVYVSVPLKFGEKEFLQFTFPQNNLPAGTAQLWIIDSKGKPVASRFFPVAESAPLQASVKAVPSVNTRGKVSAEVLLTDASGKPVDGDFSVSVVNERFFVPDSLSKGQSGTADSQFSDPWNVGKPRPFGEWDRWLITQTSRLYDWNKIMAKEQPTPLYQMSRYFHKRGLAYDATTGSPVSDSILISGFFLKNTNGYEAYTNKKGEFDFLFLFDLWENDGLFYTAERKGIEQKNVRIRWIEEGDHAPFACAQATDRRDEYGTFSAKRRLIDRSYDFYAKPQAPEAIPENPNAILEDELSGADVSINIHDYILFPTMAETIREVIPMLKHRMNNGRSIVRAYIDIDNYIPTGDPLYIIDGVITRDTNFFLSLIPDDVLTVKVVTHHDKLRALGALGKNGVVFVHTKKVDVARLNSGTIVSVEGFNRPANFKAIDHAVNPTTRKPDFRSTIYWAPSVSLSSTGRKEFSFFASDAAGPLRIIIRGVTRDGRLFSATARCDVKFEPIQK